MELRSNTPTELVTAANAVSGNLLPEKSKDKYQCVYNKFIEWQNLQNKTSFSETVLLAYFGELSEKLKPSTLWSHYSMLKATLNLNNNINIQSYYKLVSFLKRKSTGFTNKKSKILTSDNVEKFINEAPDKTYLATKVALIFGISGACRRQELCNITTNDIIKCDSTTILVKLLQTETHATRSFTITDEFYKIVKKYSALRPINTKTNRYFLKYQNGKCFQQPIGVNTIGSMPKKIASYLNLTDPQSYTGHSFRRTSATLLVDAGAYMTTLKQEQVAQEYIDDSINIKRAICKQIRQSIHVKTKESVESVLKPSTSKEVEIPYKNDNKLETTQIAMSQTQKISVPSSSENNKSPFNKLDEGSS